jgi:hypothetical protein
MAPDNTADMLGNTIPLIARSDKAINSTLMIIITIKSVFISCPFFATQIAQKAGRREQRYPTT